MFKAYLSLYRPVYPLVLVRAWQQRGSASSYLKWYWHSKDFSLTGPNIKLSRFNVVVLRLMQGGIIVQIAISLYLMYLGLWQNLVAGFAFGLACLVVYPVLWAHLIVIVYLLRALAHPKKVGKALLSAVLEYQVKKLRACQHFSLIAVVGSVGKTSAKLAIATVLGVSEKVRYQEGNYNDRLTVPLVIFNQEMPGLFNIFAWLRIIISNQHQIRASYPFHYVIVELGTDGPGQIAQFAYLKPELSVVTAVAPEHMEFFGSLDAVAEEELAVFKFSKHVLVNLDDTPAKYLAGKDYLSYGLTVKADYRVISAISNSLEPTEVSFKLGHESPLKVKMSAVGKQGIAIALAAAATAALLGCKPEAITSGLQKVTAFAGRMQILKGINDSTIIDDSYNASPKSVMAALDVLYAVVASQRIAILGNMNELGDYSQEAHELVGNYCDPSKLDYVVTIGPDARSYLAIAAKAKGCKVESFDSPYAAGEFVRNQLSSGAVVLADGSQNGVFAEESLKELLANKADASRLVRQSAYWLSIKRRQFSDAPR